MGKVLGGCGFCFFVFEGDLVRAELMMGLAMVLLVTGASYSGETVLGRRQAQACY